MRMNQDTTKAIIVACFVLHNLAMATKIIDPVQIVELNDVEQHSDDVYNENRNIQDQAKRMNIINNYFWYSLWGRSPGKEYEEWNEGLKKLHIIL